MSEYIYNSMGEPLANSDGEISLAREEIIRCRDCAYHEHWESYNQKPERDICIIYYCLDVSLDDFLLKYRKETIKWHLIRNALKLLIT